VAHGDEGNGRLGQRLVEVEGLLSGNSEDVLDALGLEALDRNQAVMITGTLNKIGAASTRFIPRALLRKIAGAIKY